MSSSPGFNSQFNCVIADEPTEFVFHKFSNKWFLIVTQFGKVSSIYTVEFDAKRNGQFFWMSEPIDDPRLHQSVPITAKCNFGVDKDEIRSAIQFLINKTELNRCPTELIISLGLKEINGKILREIAKVLNDKILRENAST